MSQRCITAFFTVTSKKPANEQSQSTPQDNSIDDSPVKLTKRRSRVQIASESEDETETHEKASSNGSNKDENLEDKENGTKSDSDENESASAKTSEKKSPRQSKAKRKKSESDLDSPNDEKSPARSPKRKKSKTTDSPTAEEKSSPKKKSPREKSPKKATGKSPVKDSKSPERKKSPEKAAPKKSPKVKSDPKKQNGKKSAKKSPERKVEEAKSSVSLTGSTVKGAEYNPHQSNYHPIDDASWKHGEKVPYLALCRTLQEIEAISARLKIIEILANYFRSVIVLSPQDLLPSVYLCLNKLAPAYEAVELGVAEGNLMKAISQCTGRTLAQLKADANSVGDLGLVAERSRSNQRVMFQPAPLTVATVFDKLKDIASMTGQASVSRKIDKIQSLFVACRHCEARYLIRSLAGKLRIGLAEQSVLQALAQACALTPPGQSYPPPILNRCKSKGVSSEEFKATIDEEALILKTTYCECPNYNLIVPTLLEKGMHALPDHCKLTPGVPLRPMLAHPTKGIHEVLKRFDNVEFTCEWKYDGERAQVNNTNMKIKLK
ncbi:hypothetical protein M8J76_012712 [Diaphorina citri]|nr:hypothetical protein M8J76_012712 [Diaphorina citri]